MNDFLENIYGILFTPDEALDKLKEQKPMSQAIVIVIVVSLLDLLLKFDTHSINANLIRIFPEIFIGLVSWLIFVLFIELVVSIFKHEGQYKTLLVLTGYALIPWLFLAPIEILKSATLIGNFFAIIFGLIVWVWVITLMFKAVSKTYDISLNRVMLILLIPFIATVINFSWLYGFWKTLYGIFS